MGRLLVNIDSVVWVALILAGTGLLIRQYRRERRILAYSTRGRSLTDRYYKVMVCVAVQESRLTPASRATAGK
jgi:hypothetical protein